MIVEDGFKSSILYCCGYSFFLLGFSTVQVVEISGGSSFALWCVFFLGEPVRGSSDLPC